MEQVRYVIVRSAFNSYGLKPEQERLSSKWIQERLTIFYKTALKSLIIQKSLPFSVFIDCDSRSLAYIQSELKKREALPSYIVFNTREENDAEVIVRAKRCDKLMIVRMDTDDLYREGYIHALYTMKLKEGVEALVNTKGYIYNYQTYELANYEAPSPPFYTLIYNAEEYIQGFRYKFHGHKEVIQVLKCQKLEGRNFMVSLTGHNTSSGKGLMKEPFYKEISVKREILRRFGIEYE